MNGVSTHPSHTLAVRDGVYFCTKCGFYAHKLIRRLKEVCGGPIARTTHGGLTLDAVELGLPPSKRSGSVLPIAKMSRTRLHSAAASASNRVPIGSEAFAVKLSDLHPGRQDLCGSHVNSPLVAARIPLSRNSDSLRNQGNK